VPLAPQSVAQVILLRRNSMLPVWPEPPRRADVTVGRFDPTEDQRRAVQRRSDLPL